MKLSPPLFILILVLAGLGAVLLLPANLAAVQTLRQALGPVSIERLEALNERCRQIGPLYQQEKYGEVAALALPVWQDSADIYLQLSSCRQQAMAAAASLQSLNKTAEMVSVCRKTVELSPTVRDEPAFQARICLGDQAVRQKDWLAAARNFAAASEISVQISTPASISNRVRAWNRLADLAARVQIQAALPAFVEQLQADLAAAPAQAGLWSQLGLAQELLGSPALARQAYEKALQLQPGDTYLKNKLFP